MMNTIKNAIFSLVILALFVFMAEMTLKFLRFPAILIDSKTRALIECRKETDEYYKKYNFNKLGLRGGREILPKQNDVYRIVCIGDSWTFGLNVPEGKSYPAYLEGFLNKGVPGMKIEVVNAGMPGNRAEEMIRFLEKNIGILTPDCIIFLGGVNGISADEKKDSWCNRDIKFYTSNKLGLFLSRSYLYNVLSILVSSLSDIFKYPEENSPGGRRAILYSAEFLDRLQKKGKTVILLNYPLPKVSKTVPYNTYQGYYNRSIDVMLKSFLKKNPKFVFIDLYNIFKQIENCNTLFLKMYYTHPNEAGYSVISNIIGAYLNKEIFLLKDNTNG
jgi:lysophospholipase L1-like esterase